MAINFNSDVVKRIINDLKISVSDGVPQQIANQIVPVLISNPERVCDIVRSTAGIAPTTVYTTPTDKDFYLVSAWAEVAGADSGAGERTITVVIDGVSQVLLSVETVNAPGTNELSPTNSNLAINPSYPIKLDRNSAVVVSGSLATGYAGIIGYTVDTLKKNV